MLIIQCLLLLVTRLFTGLRRGGYSFQSLCVLVNFIHCIYWSICTTVVLIPLLNYLPITSAVITLHVTDYTLMMYVRHVLFTEMKHLAWKYSTNYSLVAFITKQFSLLCCFMGTTSRRIFHIPVWGLHLPLMISPLIFTLRCYFSELMCICHKIVTSGIRGFVYFIFYFYHTYIWECSCVHGLYL